MMAATIPGIAAMVSRKMARLRIFSLVIDPKFQRVAKFGVEKGRYAQWDGS
jgi:hypothetical protein